MSDPAKAYSETNSVPSMERFIESWPWLKKNSPVFVLSTLMDPILEDAFNAGRKSLLQILKNAAKRFRDYEMDVDESAPPEHIEFMLALDNVIRELEERK